MCFFFYKKSNNITGTMDTYEDIYKTICRVCLSHSKCNDMVSLFDKRSGDGLSCYGQSVITFANILLKSNDNFPPMMCKNCVLLLKQAIRFKFKCENSDARLKMIMKMNQSTKQDYHEVLCQYTFFNYYFPENNLVESLKSIDKAKSPVSTTIIDKKVTENIFKLQSTIDSKKLSSINKLSEKSCKGHKENDLIDYHDADTDAERNGEDYDDKILDKLETLIITSNMDITGSPYILKSKRNKYKRLKLKTTVKKPTTFICAVCDKVLKNRLTYDRHMQRHNGCRFMCESCGKSFPTQAELNMHQVACHGIGPYLQCDHCSYKAPRKLNLIEHIRLHTGERPYACDKCGLTFRRRAIWRKHLIYHMEKNYQCPHCPKKFFRQCAMLSHMNNIHDRIYVFMCNKCGATYAKNITVRKHLSEKHGIPREMQGKIVRLMKNVGSDIPLK